MTPKSCWSNRYTIKGLLRLLSACVLLTQPSTHPPTDAQHACTSRRCDTRRTRQRNTSWLHPRRTDRQTGMHTCTHTHTTQSLWQSLLLCLSVSLFHCLCLSVSASLSLCLSVSISLRVCLSVYISLSLTHACAWEAGITCCTQASRVL